MSDFKPTNNICEPYTGIIENRKLYDGIDDNLADAVRNHKIAYYELIRGLYIELLPQTIAYKNIKRTRIDTQKLEVGLRTGYNLVIGETTDGYLSILGYIISNQSLSNPKNFFTTDVFNGKDIIPIIPKDKIPKKLDEITEYTSGNFVVVRNKTLNVYSDWFMVHLYALKLSEIEASRLSLIMQAKFSTLFNCEEGNLNFKSFVTNMYNGSPFIPVGTNFDVKDHVYQFDNPNLAQNLNVLKDEAKNQYNELNNFLGINTISVEKESGISDTEANSNKGLTQTVQNIYIKTRQKSFDLLNREYGTTIQVHYDDYAISELTEKSGVLDANNNDIT